MPRLAHGRTGAHRGRTADGTSGVRRRAARGWRGDAGSRAGSRRAELQEGRALEEAEWDQLIRESRARFERLVRGV